MPNNVIHIKDDNADAVFFDYYCANKGGVSCGKDKMKKILQKAMREELTEKQRVCMTRYYLESKTIRVIATEMSLSPSTVCRHIQNARKKIRHIADYYI